MTRPSRSPSVRFLRVVGVRATSSRPQVVAIVDHRHRVTWEPRGWDCPCGDPTCPHVDAVADLLDPKVTGGTDTEPTTPAQRHHRKD